VWSWRPKGWRQVGGDARASRRRRWQSARFTEESAPISRKPLRREGRCDTACTCGHAPFAQFFWREGPGCSGHPVFPAPSAFEGGRNQQLGRELRRETAGPCDRYPCDRYPCHRYPCDQLRNCSRNIRSESCGLSTSLISQPSWLLTRMKLSVTRRPWFWKATPT